MKYALLATVSCLAIAAALFFRPSPNRDSDGDKPGAAANNERTQTQASPPPPAASTNPPASVAPLPPPPPVPPAAIAAGAPVVPPATSAAMAASAATTNSAATETGDIQLSFQGANIDMIVQWLAKATGKSVVKHPRVQCQLTIVSSKKLSQREAINLVYRALSLEGFNSVESSQSILIVPDGQEPKMSPEFIDAAQAGVPEGRQRLIKIFPLKSISGTELKEKVKAVLSEKGTIEVADRANQIIVTDYTDNIRLIGELIKELDVPAGSDTVIEFYTLKFSEAEELGNLLSLILNAQSAPPSSPARSSSSSSSSRNSSPFPFGGGGSPPPMPTPEPSSGGGATGANLQVRIWPDKVSNRIIVAAPKAKHPEVEKLIDLLDTAKPQDVSIRVIALKNVSAEDLVRDLGPLLLKMSGKSVKDVIEVSANIRANSLIVLSSEFNFKTIGTLVTSLDTEDAQENATQPFALKNADAEDVAKQLQDLNQDQDSRSRYPYYVFSSYSMGGRTPKKPTFVADRRRNTVIVQAPPAAMGGIAKLIKELDEPVSDNGLAPKIIRLKYVSATDIEDVLNELFVKKQQQQQRMYWDPYGNPAQQENERGAGGRLYGKVRITSEPYANAIIISANSPENLAAVEEILSQLDVSSQAGETTLRVGLKFAQAVTIASSLNILFAKGGSPGLRPTPQQGQQNDGRPQQQQQANQSQSNFELEKETKEDSYYPWLGGQQEAARTADGRSATRPVSDLVGRVRVVPDRRSNALLITANVHFFPEVLKLINQLDAPTAQVLIEAKIIEVSSDFRERLGVRWSPDGSRIFDEEDLDNSVIMKSDAIYKNIFAGSAMSDSLRSGVLDASISLDFLVQFLRKNIGSKVLAEPQINIADNELGKLFVGAQVPFIDRTLSTDVGGLTQTFSYRDVGVILEVTPHINNADEVALRIRAESSNIRNGQTLFGGAILDTRNFRTDLLVKSGQTVILGGIIQREDTDTVRKVPFLGDIPGLGWAFKKKDKVSREVELMVFLRPRITRSPEEAKQLLEEVEKKTPLIKEWEKDAQPKQQIKPAK
jgi:general secretion pathway protein D